MPAGEGLPAACCRRCAPACHSARRSQPPHQRCALDMLAGWLLLAFEGGFIIVSHLGQL